jgi:hypothetical protein
MKKEHIFEGEFSMIGNYHPQIFLSERFSLFAGIFILASKTICNFKFQQNKKFRWTSYQLLTARQVCNSLSMNLKNI